MARILLTKDQVALIDDVDSDLIDYNWFAQVLRGYTPIQYAAARTDYSGILPKRLYLHRVIMSRVLGRELLRSELVDHIHHNTLDNRRSELRLADDTQSAANRLRHKQNKSGYKGVSLHKTGKYRADIGGNSNRSYLGLFDTPEEAATAYNQAAEELYGAYASVNEVL